MSKDEFKELLEAALERAAADTEERLRRSLSRNFQILLYGAGYSGDPVSSAEAAEALYLGENVFYVIIDVAVVKISDQSTTFHMVVSGHKPALFEQTWNDPPGSGPFKQLIAIDIEIED